MSANKPSSQVLGALLRGGTAEITRLLEEAQAQHAAKAGDRDAAARRSAHDLDIPEAALDALRQGHLIEAIRELRQANPGLDLGTAKQAVDRLAREVPAKSGKVRSQAAMAIAKAKRPPTVAPGDRGGIRAVVYALALAGGALAWWMVTGD